MRRVAYSGVDIVRYHDDARVIAEIDELYKVIHFICRDGIEPRNRLVEQQELFRRAHRARKQNALLLDDVLSELDEKRQDFVLNQIKSGQVFITCCEPGRFTKLGKTMEISNGQLVEG